MPITGKHALTATTPDDPLYEIRPSHWNESHVFTLDIHATEISGIFSNANGVSFGLSGGSRITASIAAGGAPGSVSAGTTRVALGEVVFSNSNGVAFGLDGATVTASHNGLTSQSNQAAQGSNGSFAFQTLSFSNANGISFGTSAGSAIFASYTVPTVTNSSWTVSGGTTSATVQRLAFSDGNGISFGLSTSNNGNHTISASYTVPVVTNSSMTVSDANSSGTLARLAFTNLNGVTLSLSTGAGGSHTIVGSHNGLTSQSGQALSGSNGSFAFQTATFGNANGMSFLTSNGSMVGSYTVPTVTNSSWTVSDSATSATVGRLAFSAANGFTFGLSTSNNGNHTITGSYTVPTQSNQTVGLYASSNTILTSSGTADARSLSFRASGIASVGISNGEVVINVPAAGALINVSAGTTTGAFAGLTFSNANNVSFGLDNGTITATVTGVGGGGGIGGGVSTGGNTAGSTGTITTGNLIFVGSGPISLSQSTGAAGSNATITINGPATSSLVGVNGISISTNGSTVSVMQNWLSSYENIPMPPNASHSLNGTSAMSHAVAFRLDSPMSMSFMRLPVSMTTRSTTFATTATANANVSAQMRSTWNVVIYSLGAGASSQSLQYVTSTSFGATWMNSMSITNTTQYSVTQAFTFGNRGVGSTHTTQYSISNSNYSLVSTHTVMHSQASGHRLLDIPFAASLPPGNYWMVFGMSSSSLTNSTNFTALTRCCVEYSTGGYMSGSNVSWGEMGQTNLTSGGLMGAGSFSTAGGGTTSSIPMSAISSFASNVRPMFQLVRSA